MLFEGTEKKICNNTRCMPYSIEEKIGCLAINLCSTTHSFHTCRKVLRKGFIHVKL